MKILKFAIVGAAVGLGIHLITKKGEDGRSILDEITDRAPDGLKRLRNLPEKPWTRLKTIGHKIIFIRYGFFNDHA